MSKVLKILIIWANPYNKNMGVAALAYSSLALINDVCKDNQIDAEYGFVGSSKVLTDQLIIDGKRIQFKNLKGLDYFELKSWLKVILKYKNYKIHKLLKADLIFDIAEGDSFTDLYGKQRFFKILNSKKFLIIFFKKKRLFFFFFFFFFFKEIFFFFFFFFINFFFFFI